MNFWLYGIEYGCSLPNSLYRDFKRDTGKCLSQLMYEVYTTVAFASDKLRAIKDINQLADADLASKVFYHLAKTEDKSVSIDELYDACIRSSFGNLNFDTDEKIAPYQVVLFKLAMDIQKANQEDAVRMADEKKLYPSSDTLREILESMTTQAQ